MGCFHQLEEFKEPPYRYRCKLCGKKLKIASGVYPKKEKERMREFKLRFEQVRDDKVVVTLLNQGPIECSTVASQMGDTIEEALDKVMLYLVMELHSGGING